LLTAAEHRGSAMNLTAVAMVTVVLSRGDRVTGSKTVIALSSVLVLCLVQC
jgi:hypothetical protein